MLTRVRTRNYRSLADVTVDVGGVTVLFGPNGSGKSTFLDALWFLRDCMSVGVDVASERRGHGIGLLWDGADDREPIAISIEVAGLAYELRCGLRSGRIDPYVGEVLRGADGGELLLERSPGSDQARFFMPGSDAGPPAVKLRKPNALALERYLLEAPETGAGKALEKLLLVMQFHHSRSFRWWPLKLRGSEIGSTVGLAEDGRNLWSVLRNLHDRRSVDARYETILGHMREAFPGFKDLVFEATGPNSVYCSMVDARRLQPIAASGMSDGHLQMLLLLTALFAEGPRGTLVLLDEPEMSLHPWPISVFARAVAQASRELGVQVMIATHSPVLLSQFEPQQILAASLVEGRTQLQRVSEMKELAALLEEYAVGSLYMSETVAPQSAPEWERG